MGSRKALDRVYHRLLRILLSEVRVAKLIEYAETFKPFAEFLSGLCRIFANFCILNCPMLAVDFHKFHEVAIEFSALVQVKFVLRDKKFEQFGCIFDRQIFVLPPDAA